MNWLLDVLTSVLDRVKAVLTGDWAGDPRAAQALLGYAVMVTVGFVVSKALLVMLIASGCVVGYSIVKEMWRADGSLVLPSGGIQSALSQTLYYLIGCGAGAAVVVLL